jgi:hypothetical protein
MLGWEAEAKAVDLLRSEVAKLQGSKKTPQLSGVQSSNIEIRSAPGDSGVALRGARTTTRDARIDRPGRNDAAGDQIRRKGMARSEGLVEALTGEREDVEAATSAGNGTALLKRRLVRVTADLAAAKARVATELHAVPGVAALMHKVEQLQSDFAEAQSTIEDSGGAPAA